MKKVIYSALGWAVGGALGWLVLRGVDWTEAYQGISKVHWSVAFVAVVTLAAAHYLKAYRWKLLLPGEKVSTERLFLVVNAGSGVNNISPVRLVAEPVQLALLTQRDGISAPKVVASLLMTHLFDLVVTTAIVALGLVTLHQVSRYAPIIRALGGASVVLLLTASRIARLLSRFSPVRGNRFLRETLAATQASQTSKGVTTACLALTVAGWMLIGLAAWLVAQAMGIGLPYWTILVLMIATVGFAGMIPAPPGIVGVYEFVVVSGLALFGVAPAAALSFALVTHALLFLPPLFIAALVLSAERGALVSAIGAATQPLRQVRLALQTQNHPSGVADLQPGQLALAFSDTRSAPASMLQPPDPVSHHVI